MRFRDVQHQDRALSILRHALGSGRTPHAYLFEGPEGVGKELAARALAARLLCEAPNLAPDAEACGGCQSCRLFAANTHPDFHPIDRGLRKVHPDPGVRRSKGLFLVVDLVPHFVIRPAATKPALGRCHVFVIRDAERMNEESQNALLKTLEEPPGQTCLILITASAERLLPTIRSRCQRVPFGLLPPAFIRQELMNQVDLSPGDAEALTYLADGRLGAALRWHSWNLLESLEQIGACLDRLAEGDPESFAKELVEIGAELATRARQPAAASDVEETVEDEEDDESEEVAMPRGNARTIATDELRDALKLALMLIAAVYRDALVRREAPGSTGYLPSQRTRTERLAREQPAAALTDAIQAVARAEQMLDRNVAPQLVGEWLEAALAGVAPVL